MRNLRAYLWAESAADALSLIRSNPGPGAFLGGGTALMVQGDPGLEFVVDLSRAGLDGVHTGPAGMVIGATTTLEDLLRNPVLPQFGGKLLDEVLRATRTEPWRRQATLAGRLLERDPCDLISPAMLVLDARVVLMTDASSEICTLETFLERRADPKQPALVLEVQVDWPHPRSGCAFGHTARSALDVPLAAVTVRIEMLDGRIAAARVATSGLPTPRRAPHVEAALIGTQSESFGPALDRLPDDIAPRDDWRASASTRAHLARVLLGRALRRACDSAMVGG